jgi:hypothetical protein
MRDLFGLSQIQPALLFLPVKTMRPASAIKDPPSMNGYAVGNTFYAAGQQGADSKGKLTGSNITRRTQSAFGRQQMSFMLAQSGTGRRMFRVFIHRSGRHGSRATGDPAGNT